MNQSALDRAAAILFALLSAALIAAFFADSRFFHWAFARHHNPLSWYIRPLFLIPFCLAAYHRSHAGGRPRRRGVAVHAPRLRLSGGGG